jgi:hypothetical protein
VPVFPPALIVPAAPVVPPVALTPPVALAPPVPVESPPLLDEQPTMPRNANSAPVAKIDDKCRIFIFESPPLVCASVRTLVRRESDPAGMSTVAFLSLLPW